MLGAPLPYLLAALVGAAVLGVGAALVRLSGARLGMGRRLAGARGMRVGDVPDLDPPAGRPVRIAGRIRCGQPLHTADDDRLVAYHRDVEVRLPGGRWRRIERLRETRSFELWDHAGSLTVDPAFAAEPLVAIPHRWQGDPSELDPAFQPALERLTTEAGAPDRARSETRMVSVTDRLLVLAEVHRDEAGRVMLRPPPGGYVISTLELDAAMRLLGGGRRRLLIAGAVAAAVGLSVLALGITIAALAWLTG